VPEIAADPPMPACYHLFPAPGIQEYQPFDPDPVMPRAGALREGKLRQSAGRPRGIANRKRRVPDLAARPLTVQAPAKDQMPAGQVYRPRHHLRARWSIARR